MTERHLLLWRGATSGGIYFGVGLTLLVMTFYMARTMDERQNEDVKHLGQLNSVIKDVLNPYKKDITNANNATTR